MTRLRPIAFLLLFALACGGESSDSTDKGSDQSATVYVTNSGTKYHRDGCRHLKSKKPITLNEATAKGYEPCRVCRPPGKGGGR